MDIEISPTDVIRAATAIETVASGLHKDSMPAAAGSPGFALTDAIARFSAQMSSTSTDAQSAMTSIASNLEASATVLRRADDDAGEAATALWSRIG